MTANGQKKFISSQSRKMLDLTPMELLKQIGHLREEERKQLFDNKMFLEYFETAQKKEDKVIEDETIEVEKNDWNFDIDMYEPQLREEGTYLTYMQMEQERFISEVMREPEVYPPIKYFIIDLYELFSMDRMSNSWPPYKGEFAANAAPDHLIKIQKYAYEMFENLDRSELLNALDA